MQTFDDEEVRSETNGVKFAQLTDDQKRAAITQFILHEEYGNTGRFSDRAHLILVSGECVIKLASVEEWFNQMMTTDVAGKETICKFTDHGVDFVDIKKADPR
jgi:hypothetical protein